MADDPRTAGSFGPNDWLVEEMYDQFKADPQSVSESWREFFANYRREVPTTTNGSTVTATGPSVAPQPDATTAVPVTTAAAAAPATVTAASEPSPNTTVLKGAAARTVVNMEASLKVPTATSVRPVPAKLLEVNRRILNNHLGRRQGGKVSFTHLIGYAVVRAVEAVPAMNSIYGSNSDGKPTVTRPEHVNLGLAVDVENPDGTRTLMVPSIKGADALDFRAFWQSYEELVRKVRTKKIGADDLAGTTMSLTNPGTIGTEHSIPRLMPGQGAIIGVGALDYPVEFSSADPTAIAELGLSKVITLTSTYDHRVIQGAESGLFLKRINDLLTGADGFYDEIFAAMGVPYEPVRWHRDIAPIDDERRRVAKQVHVQTLINIYRVRGHLIADLDPLAAKPPHMFSELDPATYGLSLWDLDREFFCDGLAGHETLPLGDILGILRDAYCRTVGVEYMHIQEPDQKHWIQKHVEGVSTTVTPEEQRHILGRLNAAEAFERFLNTKYVGQKRFGLEGAESAV
ncbi:MAG TPA: 2-oxo acid dehydrogenase subunit E2, partial [Acidimicrobiales bacterium]|nr:2-oxo acid dehydrogenase subunit E2 [Acidimicrobiales bacterium]